MHKCPKCQHEKPASDFYTKTKTRTQSWCKQCFNSYCVQRWIDRKIQAVADLGGKCHDCSNVFPYQVYDFHHLDPSQKEVNWTKLRLKSTDSINKELAKCILLCANCHRLRHVR